MPPRLEVFDTEVIELGVRATKGIWPRGGVVLVEGLFKAGKLQGGSSGLGRVDVEVLVRGKVFARFSMGRFGSVAVWGSAATRLDEEVRLFFFVPVAFTFCSILYI